MGEKKSVWGVGARLSTAWNADDFGVPPLPTERRWFVVGDVDTGMDLQCSRRSASGGPWWVVEFTIVERLTPADATA